MGCQQRGQRRRPLLLCASDTSTHEGDAMGVDAYAHGVQHLVVRSSRLGGKEGIRVASFRILVGCVRSGPGVAQDAGRLSAVRLCPHVCWTQQLRNRDSRGTRRKITRDIPSPSFGRRMSKAKSRAVRTQWRIRPLERKSLICLSTP